MSLFNRAEIIDQNFTRRVESGNFPEAKSDIFGTFLIIFWCRASFFIVDNDSFLVDLFTTIKISSIFLL